MLADLRHDLRTPLAVITGASSSLLEADQQLPLHVRYDLCQTVFDNSNRLSRLLDNLLSMTRIESGFLTVHKQLHVLEEVIGSALRQMKPVWGQRTVTTTGSLCCAVASDRTCTTCVPAGNGVGQDMNQAIEWLEKAANRGHPKAKEPLADLLESHHR